MSLMPSSPYVLFTHSLHLHPRFKQQFHFISRYHYLQSCTLTSLSLSSHSPSPQLPQLILLLSSMLSLFDSRDSLLLMQRRHPSSEDQQQARSVIGGPLNVGRDGLTLPLNITAILDRLHTLQTFEPVAARGDTVDLDQGASASSFTDVLGDLLHNKITQNLISSVAGGVGGAIGGDITKKVLNHTR